MSIEDRLDKLEKTYRRTRWLLLGVLGVCIGLAVWTFRVTQSWLMTLPVPNNFVVSGGFYLLADTGEGKGRIRADLVTTPDGVRAHTSKRIVPSGSSVNVGTNRASSWHHSGNSAKAVVLEFKDPVGVVESCGAFDESNGRDLGECRRW